MFLIDSDMVLAFVWACASGAAILLAVLIVTNHVWGCNDDE